MASNKVSPVKVGDKFGRWTVVRSLPTRRKPGGSTYRVWHCRCDCGSEAAVSTSHLRGGSSKSCGCLQVEVNVARCTTHGNAPRGSLSPEYRTWLNIVQRCTNPDDTAYENYGARGIAVCEEWRLSFDAFLRDVGVKPSRAHSIERIENHLGYQPGNVRWATRKEQNRNTRRNHFIEHGGLRLTMAEWAERLGMPYTTLQRRIVAGWAPSRALRR